MDNELSDLPIVFSEVSLETGSVTILKALSLTIAFGPRPSCSAQMARAKAARFTWRWVLCDRAAARSAGAAPIQEARRLAIVFQRPVMLRRSVAANVLFAMRARRNTVDMPEKVRAVLKRVGLAGLENCPARRLSGGEQQRLALARALATNPQVLFLDEPTASLDPASDQRVEEIVQSIAMAGVKIVMATHDLGQDADLPAMSCCWYVASNGDAPAATLLQTRNHARLPPFYVAIWCFKPREELHADPSSDACRVAASRLAACKQWLRKNPLSSLPPRRRGTAVYSGIFSRSSRRRPRLMWRLSRWVLNTRLRSARRGDADVASSTRGRRRRSSSPTGSA